MKETLIETKIRKSNCSIIRKWIKILKESRKLKWINFLTMLHNINNFSLDETGFIQQIELKDNFNIDNSNELVSYIENIYRDNSKKIKSVTRSEKFMEVNKKHFQMIGSDIYGTVITISPITGKYMIYEFNENESVSDVFIKIL